MVGFVIFLYINSFVRNNPISFGRVRATEISAFLSVIFRVIAGTHENDMMIPTTIIHFSLFRMLL